ncbi:CapA family protein [Phytomonospora sp. NPDC050363]|uniref:CapA family protein n=1 Tax=Phytomonospora sp. NPDC050363 TaxID=3155642 RepID=UPI00340EB195
MTRTTVAAAVLALAGTATALTLPSPAVTVNAPLGGPPAAAESTSTPAPPKKTVTITGTGDIILGSAPDDLPPGDAEGFFERASGVLTGDLLIGNFEGTLTEREKSSKCKPKAENCAAFRMPPGYAEVIADAGFDVLNLANNHALDYGGEGLADTRTHLNDAGIEYTGMRGEYAELTVDGVEIAVVGVSPYAWSQDMHDLEGTAALVEAAAERNDLVVVSMQAGGEGADKDHVVPGAEMFLGEDRGDVMAFSRAVIDAGADLVVGHGPHVMRGMEFYKGRLIAYSLGNFAGYRVLSTEGNRGVGGVLAVTLTIDGDWAGGVLRATRMVDGGYPAADPDNTAHETCNRLSRDDFGATAALVTEGGRITPP